LKEQWDRSFHALEIYKEEFGDCSVPIRYKTPDGISLGRWVLSQRQDKELSPIRKKRLDDLGFIWGASAL
jgi:hypothetical protein